MMKRIKITGIRSCMVWDLVCFIVHIGGKFLHDTIAFDRLGHSGTGVRRAGKEKTSTEKSST